MRKITRLIVFQILLLIVFQPPLFSKIQKSKIPHKRHFNINNVKNFVIKNYRFIWALTNSGDIVLWDIEKKKLQEDLSLYFRNKASAIHIDKKDNIHVGFENGLVMRINDSDKSWQEIAKIKHPVLSIHSNTRNNYFVILKRGIYDIEHKDTFFPQKINFTSSFAIKGSEWEPSCSFLDSQDNLWIGFDQGEFGGDLYVFNTIEKKFVNYFLEITKGGKKKEEAYCPPIISVFEDNKRNIFITSGLEHIGLIEGKIIKFSDFKGKVIYDRSGAGINGEKNGEYIGPGQFNQYSNRIYYYSDMGFFREKSLDKNNDFIGWGKIFTPKVDWRCSTRRADDYQINVKKFEFINEDDFVFSTNSNGIIYYKDGVQNTLHTNSPTIDDPLDIYYGKRKYMVLNSSKNSIDNSVNINIDGKWIEPAMDRSLKKSYLGVSNYLLTCDDKLIAFLVKNDERARYIPLKIPHQSLIDSFFFEHGKMIKSDFPVPDLRDDSTLQFSWDRSEKGKFLFYNRFEVLEYDGVKFNRLFKKKNQWVNFAEYIKGDEVLIQYRIYQKNKKNNRISITKGTNVIDVELPKLNNLDKVEEELEIISDPCKYMDLRDYFNFKFEYYKNDLYLAIGDNIFCLKGNEWVKESELSTLFRNQKILFFKYFPEYDLTFLKNGVSSFVLYNGSSKDLKEEFDFNFSLANCFIIKEKLFICTRSRGLIEAEISDLMKTFKQKN